MNQNEFDAIEKEIETLAKKISDLYHNAEGMQEWGSTFQLIKKFHELGDELANTVLITGMLAKEADAISNIKG